jgi:hypothetical protein
VSDTNLSSEKRFYSVVISRELHVYASSVDEAIEMTRGSEQYAIPKIRAEIIDPPANEAIPL